MTTPDEAFFEWYIKQTNPPTVKEAWLARVPDNCVVVPREPTEEMLKYVCNCDTSVAPCYTFQEAWERLIAASQGEKDV